MSDEPEYLTTAEVAAKLRKTVDYVARQCAAKNLKATKLGNEWRIHRDDFARFMGGGQAPATRPGRRRAS